MAFRSRWFAALAVICSTAASAICQEPALSLVPADSAIVVQIHGWERTIGRINALLKNAAPQYAPLISGQIESGLAQALNGRELKGLAKDGPVFVVFPEVPTEGDEIPEMALVAKVEKYVQFRDSFLKEDERKDLKAKQGYEATKIDDHDVFFLNKGDFVVVTSTENVVKNLLGSKFDSLAGKMSKTLEAKFLSADVSAYVSMTAINKKFGDQIASVRGVLDQAIDGLADQAGLEKSQIELTKKIYEGLFQLIEDSQQFVLALEFPPDGLHLKVHTVVGADTKTDKWFKDVKATPIPELGKLPSDAMFYTGGTLGQDLVRGNSTLMFGVGGAGAKEDKGSAEIRKELQALQIDGWLGAASLPSSGVQEIRYREPARAAEIMLKMYQAVSADTSINGMAIKGKPEVKSESESIHGFKFHSVKFTVDFEKMMEKVPEPAREMTKKMIESMAGEKQQIWFGSNGKTLLQVSAKDWKAAQELLAKYFSDKSTVSSNASYAEAIKHLPAQSCLHGLIDLPRYVHAMFSSMGDLFNQIPGLAGIKPSAPQGPGQFLGFSLGLEPRNASIDLWVPAKAVQSLMSMFGAMGGD